MSCIEENRSDNPNASTWSQETHLEGGSATLSNSSTSILNNDPRRGIFQSVTGLFSKVFEESIIASVDPLRCISIESIRSRNICRWGVRRIKSTILGNDQSESFIKGFVSTGKFGVLTQVPEECLYLVVEHFLGNGKSQEEARSLAESGTWYHVVDGGHLQQALAETINEISENFAGFKWPVVVIPWQTDENLRAIGRMCNEMQKDFHVIDFPLPDAMQSLRDIIDAHSKKIGMAIIPGVRVKPGFIKEVIEIYSGRAGYSCNTLRIVCGSVLKMSTVFVNAMRSLLTEECDEYWRNLGTKRPFGEDTRLFKKLLSTQSLKRANTFLDHKALTDEDRVNVIHRLRFLALERESFKAFQSAEIENQARSIVAARKEVLRFEKFLGKELWPKGMDNLKRNILQTTLLDVDIKEHVGAQENLLPALVTAYLRATGAHGSQKLDQYQRLIELENTSVEDELVGSTACRRNRNQGQNGMESAEQVINRGTVNHDSLGPDFNGGNDVSAPTEINEENVSEEDPEEVLNRSGIEVQAKNLLEYEQNSSEIGGSFDFIIADPFQKIPVDTGQDGQSSRGENTVLDELVDDKGVTIYLQCLRRLLTPGGFCFIFLDWNRLKQWTSCGEDSQFDILCEPFLIMKDVSRVQKMKMKGLQKVYDSAVVLKKPGNHPKGFEMNKTSPYLHIPSCRMPRWCNVIDGVPPPAQRLTFKPSRAHVRPNEKPCELYIELLTTFCPANGNVLDPFAGVLTTGLACLATNRTCVLLETDEKCISYAKPRLQDFARSRMEELLDCQQMNSSDQLDDERSEREGGDAVNDAEGASCTPRITNTAEANVGSGQNENLTISCIEMATRRNTRVNNVSAENTSSDIADHTPVDEETDSDDASISPRQNLRGVANARSSHENPSSRTTFVGRSSAEQQLETTSLRSSGKTNRALFVSDVSTPVASKRTRQIRSPRTEDQARADSSTPSVSRRSKRSRRPVARYEH